MKTLAEIKSFVENEFNSIICGFSGKHGMPLDGFIVSSADIEEDYVYVVFKEPFYNGEYNQWVDEVPIVERCEEVLRNLVSGYMLDKYGIITKTSNWTSMSFCLPKE